MKHFLPLFLFTLSFFGVLPQSFAQNFPHWYDQTHDIEVLIPSQPDSAWVLIEKAQHINMGKDNALYQAHLHTLKAIIHINRSEFDKAIQENKLSDAVNRKHQFHFGLAYNYFIEGQIAHRKADYVKATDFYHKSITESESSQNYLFLHNTYHSLCGIYIDQEQYDLSMKYAQKSIDLYQSSHHEMQYITAISLLAMSHKLKGNFTKAEEWYGKALKAAQKNNNKQQAAWILGNWSLMYEDDLIKSLEMSLQAQQIWDEIYPEGTSSANNLGNIGWYYHNIALQDSILQVAISKKLVPSKNVCLDRAESYYLKSTEIAQKHHYTAIYVYFSQTLSELQYKRGKYQLAYENLLQFQKLNDSIFSQENKNKIAELENAKAMAVKDKQIQINQLLLKSKERQRILFLLLALMSTFVGILLLYQNKKRRENNVKLTQLNLALEQSNYIKNRFFNILNHDLRTPLAHIIQFYHYKKDTLGDSIAPDLNQMEERMMQKTEHLLFSMEDLLMWGKSQMNNFNPQIEPVRVEELFAYLGQHFSYLENQKIRFENDAQIILHTDAHFLKTITRNLTDNAIKAVGNQEGEIITWRAFLKDNVPMLTITDVGKNLKKENLDALYHEHSDVGIKNGLGLHLIRELASSIKVDIQVSQDQGTRITLIFPPKESTKL
jgi:signal transduction histidine kinase